MITLAAAVQTTFLGTRVRIGTPAFLFLALLAIVLGAFAAVRALMRQRAARRLVPQGRQDDVLRGAGASGGVLSGGCFGTGLCLLCIAAAGPQCGERTEVIKRGGVDLAVILDASSSMLARDVRPSRIARAKLEILALLDRLKGDRVGLVVFAGEAFVQCPLTVDYGAARLFLRAVDPLGVPQQGTAVAAALREAQRMLDSGGRAGAARVALLVSDGEDQEGDAREAAQELSQAGIRVFAAAVGREGGEPIPFADPSGKVQGYKKDAEGHTVLTRARPDLLAEIAGAGGGRLLRGQGEGPDLGPLVDELDKLERGEVESRLTVQYAERYAAFAAPAFVFLCLAAALGEGPLSFLRFRKRGPGR